MIRISSTCGIRALILKAQSFADRVVTSKHLKNKEITIEVRYHVSIGQLSEVGVAMCCIMFAKLDLLLLLNY